LLASRKLVLARNAAVHRDNPGVLQEYAVRVSDPRFLDEEGAFFVDLPAYHAAAQDVKRFISWLLSELKKI